MSRALPTLALALLVSGAAFAQDRAGDPPLSEPLPLPGEDPPPPKVDPALPEDAIRSLQELEREQRPRVSGYASFLSLDDEQASRAGIRASRLLSEQIRLHAGVGYARFSGELPALPGSPRFDRDYATAEVWLSHEVEGLGRRLILEPGLDLYSGDGGSALASPRLRATFKVFDESILRSRIVAFGQYRNLWSNPVDALAFEGRVSDYRLEWVNELGIDGEIQLIELAFSAGWRRYEVGGRRTGGSGFRQFGKGERYVSARVDFLLAQDPIRVVLGYELYRSRLDLDAGERGRIPIIEDSFRHTINLRVEGRLTHTLSGFVEGFLSGDVLREIDFGQANGGRLGLTWLAGLRLRVEGSYGYNSESILGTSGEVHEAQLELTYVF